ncbi:MAG: hypothetical protein GXO25_07475 [Euryarchaeota archaeon]|nr:hypothetical protein [Euryarchaeota archaeon]
MEMTAEGRTGVDPGRYGTLGLILLILGIIGIIFPVFATWMVVWLIAFLLIIGGFALVFGTAYVDRKNFGGWILGLILLIFGFAMLFYPYFGAVAMTTIMGIFFIIAGIGSIIFAFAVREYRGWWLPIISGVISLILAALIFVGWPESSKWIIGLFVGIDLLLQGISLMVMSKFA